MIITYANILRAEKQSRLTHKSSFTTVESWKVYVLKCVQRTFSNSYVFHWGIYHVYTSVLLDHFFSCSWVKNTLGVYLNCCVCISTIDGHVVLESVRYPGQHVGVTEDGEVKKPGHTGKGKHAQFTPIVIGNTIFANEEYLHPTCLNLSPCHIQLYNYYRCVL